MAIKTILRNMENCYETAIYTDAPDQTDLIKIDAYSRDRLELIEITTELFEQGQARISGSNIYAPRMIERELSRKILKSGYTKKNQIIWNS